MSFSNPFRGRKRIERARDTTTDDIRAAIDRVCHERFGARSPIRVEGVRGGTVFVRVPSSPWKAEVIWSEQEILSRARDLLGELSSLSPRLRIAVFL